MARTLIVRDISEGFYERPGVSKGYSMSCPVIQRDNSDNWITEVRKQQKSIYPSLPFRGGVEITDLTTGTGDGWPRRLG